MQRLWWVFFHVCVGAGCFAPPAPAPGTVLCRSDDECQKPQHCNLTSHVCTEGGDDEPPALLGVAIDPIAVQSGPVSIRVTADEPLVEDPLPVLTLAGGSSALALGAPVVDGVTATWTVQVGDDDPEGYYRIAHIELSDGAGNRAIYDVDDKSILVDRTAAEIRNVNVLDPTPEDGALRLSDLPPDDVLRVSFLVSETPGADGISLSVGSQRIGLSSGCVLAEENLLVTCEMPVTTPTFVEGGNAVELAMTDVAGNRVERSLMVDVDVSPPVVAEGAAQLTVIREDRTQLIGPGALLRVSFTVDEELGDPPALVLAFPDHDLAFVETENVGRYYVMEATVDETAADGRWPLLVSLSDTFGHSVARAPLALAPPYAEGVPVTRGVISGCPMPVTVPCLDLDNDGQFAPTASCPQGADCNDLDPSIFPGAPELPSDGKDNDCQNDGDDANPGTAAAPVLTWLMGVQRARERGLGGVYFGPGDFLTCGTTNVDDLVFVGNVGGDASTQSIVESCGRALAATQVGVWRIDLAGTPLRGAGIVLVDTEAYYLQALGSVVVLDSQGSTDVGVEAGGARLIYRGGKISSLTVSAGHVIVDGSEVPGRPEIYGGRADILNAVMTTGIEVFGGVVTVTHTLFSARGGVTSQLRSSGGELRVTASALIQSGAATVSSMIVSETPGTLRLRGLLVYAITPGQTLWLLEDGTPVTDPALLSPCPAASVGCIESSDIEFAEPSFLFGDNLHPGPQSPMLDGPLWGDDYADLPQSLIIDRDGECRFIDGLPDLGAVESS